MSVEDLRVYKKSLELVKEIYSLIKNNKNLSKDYALCDQIGRSSVSVATNISEGYCRTKNYFKNYLKISTGSANETVTLLQIIKLVYDDIDTEKLQREYNLLAKQISA